MSEMDVLGQGQQIFCRTPPSYCEGFAVPICSAPLCGLGPGTARQTGAVDSFKVVCNDFERPLCHTGVVYERHVQLDQVINRDPRSTQHHKISMLYALKSGYKSDSLLFSGLQALT